MQPSFSSSVPSSLTRQNRPSMETLSATFIHYKNSSFHQDQQTRHLNSAYSFQSLSLRIKSISFEARPLSISLGPPSSSQSLCSSDFHPLNELNGCNDLDSVKAVHGRMIKTLERLHSDSMEALIARYLEFRDFRSASTVFFMGFARNYLIWRSFLAEFERFGGRKDEVLKVFVKLQRKGVVFDGRVLSIVLRICTVLMDSLLGLEIRSNLIKRGLDSDPRLACELVCFYGQFLDLERSNKLLDEMPQRDDFLWNEAVIFNLRGGKWAKAVELFREMQFAFAKASVAAILKMLQGCSKVGALDEGKQIHGYVLKLGLRLNSSICNSLIIMYSRNGKLKLARQIFESMRDHNLSSWNSIISSYTALGLMNDAMYLFHRMEPSDVEPDIVTWNSLLSGYALGNSYREAIDVLKRMQTTGFRPDASSITSLLQAVAESRFLKLSKGIHGYVLRNGLQYDVYVETSLINTYVKNDCLVYAQRVFCMMDHRNIIAWNSLISGFSYKGLFEDAKNLLKRMEMEDIKPDLVTWNSLLSGYSTWGKTEEAFAVIQDIKDSGLNPNVVSWTTLISGSSKNGNFREALEIFIQMQEEGVNPNSATISSLLRTCSRLSLLQSGKEVHDICIKNGLIHNVYVATALIDMYTKSGDLTSACEVFQSIENKTLASWNCMIMGFAIHGQGKEAIALFNEMLKEGIHPDPITFTSVLSACKNSGLVHEGWKCFDLMSTDYHVVPTIEHYSCMVDLLGKSGYLDEAWDFIQTMPLKPDATIWGVVLSSCRIHRNIKLAETAWKNLYKIEPFNSANYVMMMNLYAMLNRWDDVERVWDLMRSLGVRIHDVWSWIQIDRTVHVFYAEGKPHPDEGEIYFELHQLISEMKKFGYVPDTSCVHQNMDESQKEKLLIGHTEKLAMTYGLIKTNGSAPVRVIKNTRVCPDCHSVAKFMSLLRKREIFLRDTARVHYFRHGKCSCNDSW